VVLLILNSKLDALLPLLFNFALEYTIRMVQEQGRAEIEWDTPAVGLC
jgi:hypothetical protein